MQHGSISRGIGAALHRERECEQHTSKEAAKDSNGEGKREGTEALTILVVFESAEERRCAGQRPIPLAIFCGAFSV